VQQKPETQDPASQPAEKQPAEAAKADPSSQPSEHVPAKEPPQKRPAPVITGRPAGGPLTVMVMTDPPGANAILDNNPETSCKTPCLLNVSPGRHTVTMVREGYQHESREFRITDSPIELPLLNLRAQTGTLMLSSTPSGAAIYVNDRLTQQATPSQLNLPPGKYNVRVEKDGIRKSESVEIRNGVTSYLRIPLQ